MDCFVFAFGLLLTLVNVKVTKKSRNNVRRNYETTKNVIKKNQCQHFTRFSHKWSKWQNYKLQLKITKIKYKESERKKKITEWILNLWIQPILNIHWMITFDNNPILNIHTIHTTARASIGFESVPFGAAARIAASCISALVLTPIQLHAALVYVLKFGLVKTMFKSAQWLWYYNKFTVVITATGYSVRST